MIQKQIKEGCETYGKIISKIWTACIGRTKRNQKQKPVQHAEQRVEQQTNRKRNRQHAEQRVEQQTNRRRNQQHAELHVEHLTSKIS